jgi:hypothetical protein
MVPPYHEDHDPSGTSPIGGAYAAYSVQFAACGAGLSTVVTQSEVGSPTPGGTKVTPAAIEEHHMSIVGTNTLDIADGVAGTTDGMIWTFGPWSAPYTGSAQPRTVYQTLATTMCSGSSLPAMAAIVEPEPSFWDWLMRYFLDEEEIIPTVGGDPPGTYSTLGILSTPKEGVSQDCQGTVVGDGSTMLSAAHCYGDHTSIYDTQKTVQIDDTGASDKFPTHIKMNPQYISTSDAGHDQVVGWLPPGESFALAAAPLYNPTTDAASCTQMLSNRKADQCEVFVGWDTPTSPLDGTHVAGYCIDPPKSWVEGGASGGPLYAIGDWGSGTEHRLAATLGGGNYVHSWSSVRNDNATWIDSVLAAVTPLTTTFGLGITIKQFWISHQDRDTAGGFDIAAAPMDITCGFTVSTTGDPIANMGCEFFNPETGKTKSCYDATATGDQYECVVTLPEDSGDQWELRQIFCNTTTGGTVRRLVTEFYTDGLVNDQPKINSSPADTTVPTLVANWPPVDPSPGGDFTCTIEVNGTDVRAAGCVYESVSYGSDLICAKHTENGEALGNYYHCTGTVPADVPAGSVWTLKQTHAQDLTFHSATSATGSGFTVFDCAYDGAGAISHSGAGTWDTDKAVSNASGFETLYAFYARASVTNQVGYVAFAETSTWSAMTDAMYGIRFDNDGTIDVWNNASAWLDTSFTYEADTWYKFDVRGLNVTYAGGGQTPGVSVFAAKCGEPATKIADGLSSGPRVYDGIEHWNIYSGDVTQTIDVEGMSLDGRKCTPTRCLYGESFCDVAPDGCGGTIIDGPCVDCSATDAGTCDPDHLTCS